MGLTYTRGHDLRLARTRGAPVTIGEKLAAPDVRRRPHRVALGYAGRTRANRGARSELPAR
jgi:hypothetical protein